MNSELDGLAILMGIQNPNRNVDNEDRAHEESVRGEQGLFQAHEVSEGDKGYPRVMKRVSEVDKGYPRLIKYQRVTRAILVS